MTPLLLLAALSAVWAPSAKFSLVCQGTQVGYQERAPQKLSLPWAETYTIDLGAGTWCSQTCNDVEPIGAISAATLDLQPPASDGTSPERFTVIGGGFQSVEISGDGSSTDRFHLEKTGTCTIKP